MKKKATLLIAVVMLSFVSGCAAMKKPKPCSSFAGFGSIVPCDKPERINKFF